MNDFIEIRKVIQIIRRRLWLVIFITLAGAAIGYGASQWQTRVYEATTTIMVGQFMQADALNKADLLTSEILAKTYVDMALRQPVLQGVIDTLDLPGTWRELKTQIQANLVEGTPLIQITVEAGSTALAQSIANEVVRQLTFLNPTAGQAQAKPDAPAFAIQQITNLQKKIEIGQARLQTLETTSIESFARQSVQQIQELQTSINTLKALINQWESDYTQLLLYIKNEKHSNLLTVIEPAQARLTPVLPRADLNTGLAGAVGLLVALGLVLLLEFRDNTLKSPDELALSLGIPALGVINNMGKRNNQAKLLLSQASDSPVAEAYRIIRSNIEFKTVDQPVKTIVVTSPGSGEGKSITAANLGITIANAGYRTIIVDADLRHPTQHHLFQIASAIGLAEAICLPDAALTGQLLETKVRNLQVLIGGTPPTNPAELLGSQRMRQLLVTLSEIADVVIFDTPPVSGLTDARILANRADGVVLVIEAGQTQVEAARQAIANLQQANANVIGAVLNRGHLDHQKYYRSAKRIVSPGLPIQAKSNQRWQWLPF